MSMPAADPGRCLSARRRWCSSRRLPRDSRSGATPRSRPTASACWRPSCRGAWAGSARRCGRCPRARPTGFHWGRWFTTSARAGWLTPRHGRRWTRSATPAVGRWPWLGDDGAGRAAVADPRRGGREQPLQRRCVRRRRRPRRARSTRSSRMRDRQRRAARRLRMPGFAWRDLGTTPWARFDVDTTLDLALLRLATRLPGTRPLDRVGARLPGDGATARRPGAGGAASGAIGEVMRDRGAELVVAGRVPASTWQELETETACRVRCFVEERGMRSARGGRWRARARCSPRSRRGRRRPS